MSDDLTIRERISESIELLESAQQAARRGLDDDQFANKDENPLGGINGTLSHLRRIDSKMSSNPNRERVSARSHEHGDHWIRVRIYRHRREPRGESEGVITVHKNKPATNGLAAALQIGTIDRRAIERWEVTIDPGVEEGTDVLHDALENAKAFVDKRNDHQGVTQDASRTAFERAFPEGDGHEPQ